MCAHIAVSLIRQKAATILLSRNDCFQVMRFFLQMTFGGSDRELLQAAQLPKHFAFNKKFYMSDRLHELLCSSTGRCLLQPCLVSSGGSCSDHAAGTTQM
mmetsp:Transcript_68419/g.193894  ORF Transcript_68419/g.193894 Transcript_68419/m.193894 type:complete len:100 (+) Transcript_68419:112-411(+)